MKAMLRTTWAAMFAIAAVPAQNAPRDAAAALARAQLLEEAESDPGTAERAYRDLLADAAAAGVHGEAALRLGAMLWRLDRRDDGRPWLERAVSAGGEVAAHATAVLQGQDEPGKQAAERLAKAKAIVDRIVDVEWLAMASADQREASDGRVASLKAQLRWLGEAAAVALVERLTRLHGLDEGQFVTAKGDWIPERTLAAALWATGGAAAREYLTRVADEPKVALRRFVTMPLRQGKVAADLEPLLLRFARDADPTNEVWENVATAFDTAPIDWLVRGLADTQAGPRAAALRALARRWPGLDPGERTQFVTAAGDAALLGRNDGDGRVAHASWELLRAFVSVGPNAGRLRFLSVAKQCPDDLATATTHRLTADAELMRALAAAARQLGPKDAARPRPVMTTVSALLHRQQPEWDAAAVDDVVTLLELGYGEHVDPQVEWLVHAIRHASEPQLGRLIDLLPRASSTIIPFALSQLANMPLAAGVFPHLRALAEAVLDGRVPGLVSHSATQPRILADGKMVRVAAPAQCLEYLLRAIHRTRADAAAAWLGEATRRHPDLVETFTPWLLELSRTGVPTAAAELRTLLVWPGTADQGLDAELRTRLFAELARLGDTAAIPLFPQAYELGLQRSSIGWQNTSFDAAGIGFLANWRGYGSRGPQGAWHGYGDADLVTAWRTLLTSPAADAAWTELACGEPPPRGPRPTTQARQPGFELPLAVLPLVCTLLPAQWARLPDAEARRELTNHTLSALQRLRRDDVPDDGALAAALRALFASEPTELATQLFVALPGPVLAQFAADARRTLQRSPDKTPAVHLLRAGIELPVDEWRALLATGERNALEALLPAVPPRLGEALRPAVAAHLAHAVAEVRWAACLAMQRLYGSDAVADLMPLLQDGDEPVRKAARGSLDQLREEHERRAFWTAAKSGIDVSPAATAAKLLAQARAGEPKEQRLLALRSLGVLGAAEALPHLIDWTKDADAEVAAAARAAIAVIHQGSGAAGPAKK